MLNDPPNELLQEARDILIEASKHVPIGFGWYARTVILIDKINNTMGDGSTRKDEQDGSMTSVSTSLIQSSEISGVDYHAATAAYVHLGFDKDGKVIEGNIYDLIKQVVDAAIKPKPVSGSVSFNKCVQHLADYRQGLGSSPSQETTAYAQIVLEAAGVKYDVD